LFDQSIKTLILFAISACTAVPRSASGDEALEAEYLLHPIKLSKPLHLIVLPLITDHPFSVCQQHESCSFLWFIAKHPFSETRKLFYHQAIARASVSRRAQRLRTFLLGVDSPALRPGRTPGYLRRRDTILAVRGLTSNGRASKSGVQIF
jgi:hypothetical protein